MDQVVRKGGTYVMEFRYEYKSLSSESGRLKGIATYHVAALNKIEALKKGHILFKREMKRLPRSTRLIRTFLQTRYRLDAV
jgi:hypothetical protein